MTPSAAAQEKPTSVLRDLEYVERKLAWMREHGIWPDGPRYLWTDAFGLVLLISLYRATGTERYLDEARELAAEVDRVLAQEAGGLRIGEEPEREGQYFHYLSMWLYALHRLGRIDPQYKARALELVRETHPRFVRPGFGVYWKMKDDLSGPMPGFGVGALDPFHGYVVYRLLDEEELASEIRDMHDLIQVGMRNLHVTQDLGIGMMLWLSHFFPRRRWAALQRHRCLEMLQTLWIDPPGYFCRQVGKPATKFAFTNYGVSLGLQAVGAGTAHVHSLHRFFDAYHAGDEYDEAAITHVMSCCSHFPGELIPKPLNS